MILLLVIFLLLPITDQTPNAPVQCLVSVHCDGDECFRSLFIFTASVTGSKSSQELSYKWTVYNGRIEQGQGTPTIRVVETKAYGSVTAKVEVNGLPGNCSSIASSTVNIERGPQAVKFDEFGAVSLPDLKMRLDAFGIQLTNNPGAQGYLVSNLHWPRADFARRRLITKYNLEPGRIVYVNQNTRGPLVTTLYIVPAGAVPPTEK